MVCLQMEGGAFYFAGCVLVDMSFHLPRYWFFHRLPETVFFAVTIAAKGADVIEIISPSTLPLNVRHVKGIFPFLRGSE